MENIYYVVYSIIGFFVISILGTLFHFLYKFSNMKLFIPFFAVNESIYEHIKIGIIPMYIYGTIEFLCYKYKNINIDNFSISLLLKIVIFVIFILILYFGYYKLIKKDYKNNLIYDIFIFYFSIFLAQFVSYFVIIHESFGFAVCFCSYVMISFILFITIYFTYVTPKHTIFKDNKTGTYGIYKIGNKK